MQFIKELYEVILEKLRFLSTGGYRYKWFIRTHKLLPVDIPSLGVYNGVFLPNSKINKIFTYFTFLLMIVINVLIVMFCLSVDRKITCTYNGTSGYNCVISQKNIYKGIKNTNYANIKSANVYKGRIYGRKGLLQDEYRYRISFVDVNGSKHYYEDWSTRISSARKMAEILNSEFFKNQNFEQKMPGDWFYVFLALSLTIVFIIMLFIFRDTVNNYVFAEVEPGVYKPVLRINGVGKLSDAEILALIKQKNDMEK